MSRRVMYLASFVLVLMLAGTSAGQSDPDFVGWWKLDEGSGGTAYDSSGYGNDGILAGDCQWAPGYYGGAIQFDGIDDYVDCGNNSNMNIGTGSASITAWVKFSEFSPEISEGKHLGSIAGKGYLGGNISGHGLYVNDDKVNYQARKQASNTNTVAWSDDSLNDGNWHHVAGVLIRDDPDEVRPGVRLYVDGVLQSLDARTMKISGALQPFDPSELEGVNLDNTFAFAIGSRSIPAYAWDINGDIDDVRLYTRALTEAEVRTVMTGKVGLASGPNPADEATDVLRDVIVSWMPGEFADKHDLYFGTNFNDVNDADRTNPLGVLVSQNQDASTYNSARLFEFGQTYYWRIDEVNAAPDYTVFKGDVWRFAAESFAIPIPGEGITVAASSANRADEGPENTVDGSGLDGDDLHSDESTDMWLSNMNGPQPTWIQYEFDRVYKLHQMLVWNHNSRFELMLGFGCKDVTIEYSQDGNDYATLGTTHEFAQASGTPGHAYDTAIDFDGVAAKYIRLTPNSNWGFLTQYGLSEVRFLYVPVWAREPSPASGATDVGVDAILNWRAGREAAQHDVYLGTDEQTVIDGTAPVVTMTEPSYVSTLDVAGTYYWRIAEVNDAETPTTWQGDIWNFSTQEYLVVDDFESYNDIEAGQEGSNLAYLTWIDGFDNPSVNGSTMGYTAAFQPSMEKSVVHDGSQSAPLFYDNTTAAYSEITANIADLQVGQDWTMHGVKALTLRFSGDPTNAVQQMYIKLNGVKVPYDGSAEDTRLAGWQMWYIDLASTGVNLSNVTELAIGFERIGAVGGQGMILLDGIRLYSHDRQLVTPVEPGTTGLQAHFEFEGNTNDSSGNARHGTVVGNPVFEAGKIEQAISFDGLNDYVNIDGYKGITAVNEVQAAFSVACWVKTTSPEGEMVTWGSSDGAPVGGQYCTFRVNEATLRAEHGDGNLRGNTPVNDGQWHHVALTVVQGGNLRVPNTVLYVDGRPDSVFSGSDNIYNLTADADVNIGRRAPQGDRHFIGSIDDVRIYNRVLSQEEVAWLAGRIEPFDKPF